MIKKWPYWLRWLLAIFGGPLVYITLRYLNIIGLGPYTNQPSKLGIIIWGTYFIGALIFIYSSYKWQINTRPIWLIVWANCLTLLAIVGLILFFLNIFAIAAPLVFIVIIKAIYFYFAMPMATLSALSYWFFWGRYIEINPNHYHSSTV